MTVQTTCDGTVFHAVLDQGRPEYGRTAIAVPDFAFRLAATGAQFVYLLDPDGLEGRH